MNETDEIKAIIEEIGLLVSNATPEKAADFLVFLKWYVVATDQEQAEIEANVKKTEFNIHIFIDQLKERQTAQLTRMEVVNK